MRQPPIGRRAWIVMGEFGSLRFNGLNWFYETAYGSPADVFCDRKDAVWLRDQKRREYQRIANDHAAAKTGREDFWAKAVEHVKIVPILIPFATGPNTNVRALREAEIEERRRARKVKR